MRRSDREIKDPAELEYVLRSARVLYLGLCHGKEPYVVPLYYGYADGAVYIHCATEGKKLDLMRINPRVTFVVEAAHELYTAPKPCDWTAKFSSVMGFGTAEILTDPADKQHGLWVLMKHCGGPTEGFDETQIPKTAVVKINIEKLTGKRNA